MREVLGHDQPVWPDKGAAGGADAFFAVGGKGDVANASMAAVEGPFSFAVADDEDAGGGHVGGATLVCRCGIECPTSCEKGTTSGYRGIYSEELRTDREGGGIIELKTKPYSQL